MELGNLSYLCELSNIESKGTYLKPNTLRLIRVQLWFVKHVSYIINSSCVSNNSFELLFKFFNKLNLVTDRLMCLAYYLFIGVFIHFSLLIRFISCVSFKSNKCCMEHSLFRFPPTVAISLWHRMDQCFLTFAALRCVDFSTHICPKEPLELSWLGTWGPSFLIIQIIKTASRREGVIKMHVYRLKNVQSAFHPSAPIYRICLPSKTWGWLVFSSLFLISYSGLTMAHFIW